MPRSLFSPEPGASPEAGGGVSPPGRRLILSWLCFGLGLVAVAALVWLFGLTWWTAGVALLVIGCPVLMAWLASGGLER